MDNLARFRQNAKEICSLTCFRHVSDMFQICFRWRPMGCSLGLSGCNAAILAQAKTDILAQSKTVAILGPVREI